MPGHAGSPYWAAVDFDSEGDEEPQHPNYRVYLDPWDNEGYGHIQDTTESSGDNFNSFAGEPISASFYYVPTKNYESEEEMPCPPNRRVIIPEEYTQEYIHYGRKFSRQIAPEYHPDVPIYSDRPMRDRRRSVYIEEPIYAPHPALYEPLYGPMMTHPAYQLPPRSRMSLPHPPDYVIGHYGYTKQRRHSRMTDAYEHYAYETLSPDYEDWARPFPKTAPENFHLSRYGHLQIDYSCSWNSLDRLIRNS